VVTLKDKPVKFVKISPHEFRVYLSDSVTLFVDNKISYFSYNVSLRLGNYRYLCLYDSNFQVSDALLDKIYGFDEE